ncbi:hypothetical protein FKM82_009471 [Ascaphus truei]
MKTHSIHTSLHCNYSHTCSSLLHLHSTHHSHITHPHFSHIPTQKLHIHLALKNYLLNLLLSSNSTHTILHTLVFVLFVLLPLSTTSPLSKSLFHSFVLLAHCVLYLHVFLPSVPFPIYLLNLALISFSAVLFSLLSFLISPHLFSLLSLLPYTLPFPPVSPHLFFMASTPSFPYLYNPFHPPFSPPPSTLVLCDDVRGVQPDMLSSTSPLPAI